VVNEPAPGDLTEAKLEDLPTPDGSLGWPIIGDTLEIMRDPLMYTLVRLEKYGKIYKSNSFGRKSIVIFGAENVQNVLIGDASRNVESKWAGPIERLLGPHAIITQNGEDHTRLRRLIGPFFTAKATESYLPFIVQGASDFCERFVTQGTFTLLTEMKRYAFAVNTTAVLGMDFSEKSAGEALELFKIFINGFISFEINLPFTKFGKAMKARTALLEIIKESVNESKSTPEDRAPKVLQQVLDARDENGNGLTQDEIGDLMLNLLFAGFDTTATTMTSIIFQLAQYPEVWDKLRTEQRQIIEEFGVEITPKALGTMSYADAVMKETMRLRVLVGGVFRRVTKTFELDGYRIPEGWTLQVQTGGTTRLLDDRWMTDADEFRPERFLEEGASKGAYMPWGLGPHLCLGKTIAEVEMKAILAVLARKYRVIVEDPDADTTRTGRMIPLNGVPVRVERLH